MPELIIVRGLPGSGKSVYARDLCNYQNSLEYSSYIHLEADMYMYHNGKYEWSPDKLPDAHKWCHQSTYIFLQQGYSVVVANTFITKREVNQYVRIAENLGIQCSIKVCTEKYESIHNVPKETIERMERRWEDV